MTKGRISSEESMGLVDGPGIRYVVFMQGCSLRCKYCHNPETWDKNGKSYTTSPSKLAEKIERYKPYFKEEGGVTFSGGEPLLQPQFLFECLKECKKRNINTAIDTAGVGLGDYEELLKYCDLVILDIKAVDQKKYLELTGKNIKYFNEFLEACQKANSKLWLRQVIVPGLNDTKEDMKALAEFIKNIKNVENVELLPYKTMGVEKYRRLGIPYRLEGVSEMDETECKNLEHFLKQCIKQNN